MKRHMKKLMPGKKFGPRQPEDPLTLAETIAILVTLVALGILGFGVVAA